MNLIKSLMGRRQFLIAAGVTSTSALALNKLAGVVDPVFQTGVAMASERTGDCRCEGNISNRYSHLLSPLKIGNVVLKNRMMATRALPSHLQGPETFPSRCSDIPFCKRSQKRRRCCHRCGQTDIDLD